MSNTKLKPCPFCGGKATLRKSEETKLYHIACFECGCRQDSSYKAKSVINAWNTRKPMDNIVAELTDKILDSSSAHAEAIIGMCCNSASVYSAEIDAYNNAIDIVKRGEINEQ